MRAFSILLTFSLFVPVSAQNGPGGVGTAATNVLWLRGDKGVTVSGTAVTGWSDGSGNGHLASPASIPVRPTLATGALNGYPTLSFDGIDDELRIPDANSLDMTQWDMFIVCAATTPKSNNVWLSKGTNAQPNYAMWSNATNALQMPIYDVWNALSSPGTSNNATASSYNLLQYNNTIIAVLFPSRTIYRNGSSIYNDANLLRLPQTNGNALYIGNTQGTTGWNLNGNIAEVILYKAGLTAVQRIIVNNYLAAKYALSLGSGDVYTQDNVANGNYDHDVAGIGRVNSSAIQNDSRGTGIVQVSGPTNLGDNEFLFWGHDNGALGTYGSTDYPVSLQGRWFREWRVSETNATGTAVDVGAVDITFDLTGLGAVTASDLRLLVDANNNDIFADDTPISGATSLGGNRYRFSGVTALSNNLRFTLGTIDRQDTPLPIELLFFSAAPQGSDVRLDWATASERDNARFVVERSTDLETWTEVGKMDGAGTSEARLDYVLVDGAAPRGTIYYRLKQVDYDGTATWSDVAVVHLASLSSVSVQPNPATDAFSVLLPEGQGPFDVFDAQGRSAHPVVVRYGQGRAEVDASGLAPGVYTLRFAGDVPPVRVVVRR